MHLRESQNKIVERAVTKASGQTPLRNTIMRDAQRSDATDGALATPRALGRRTLRCGTVPLNEGKLG